MYFRFDIENDSIDILHVLYSTSIKEKLKKTIINHLEYFLHKLNQFQKPSNQNFNINHFFYVQT